MMHFIASQTTLSGMALIITWEYYISSTVCEQRHSGKSALGATGMPHVFTKCLIFHGQIVKIPRTFHSGV
jgi:hypothetical protein